LKQPDGKVESGEFINLSAINQHLGLRMGADIFTKICDIYEPHKQARNAVLCHFDECKAPSFIRLHFSREPAV
jgi:hypothetical protein